MRGVIFALFALVGAAHGTIVNSMADVKFWVGSGPNSAVLILDWQDGKNLPGDTAGQALAWGFRWGAAQTRTGMDMLLAIAAADPRLEVQLDNRGFGNIVFGIYHDLNGNGGTYQFDPNNELGSASDPEDHFREGWLFNGFWGYRVGAMTGMDLPLLWSESGTGAASRTLTNGAWDAWVFSTDLINFSIPTPVAAAAAIPEPGSALLLIVGGFILRRRR